MTVAEDLWNYIRDGTCTLPMIRLMNLVLEENRWSLAMHTKVQQLHEALKTIFSSPAFAQGYNDELARKMGDLATRERAEYAIRTARNQLHIKSETWALACTDDLAQHRFHALRALAELEEGGLPWKKRAGDVNRERAQDHDHERVVQRLEEDERARGQEQARAQEGTLETDAGVAEPEGTKHGAFTRLRKTSR